MVSAWRPQSSREWRSPQNGSVPVTPAAQQGGPGRFVAASSSRYAPTFESTGLRGVVGSRPVRLPAAPPRSFWGYCSTALAVLVAPCVERGATGGSFHGLPRSGKSAASTSHSAWPSVWFLVAKGCPVSTGRGIWLDAWLPCRCLVILAYAATVLSVTRGTVRRDGPDGDRQGFAAMGGGSDRPRRWLGSGDSLPCPHPPTPCVSGVRVRLYVPLGGPG